MSKHFYTQYAEWLKYTEKQQLLDGPLSVRTVEGAILLPLRRRADTTTVGGSFEGGVCDANGNFITGIQRSLHKINPVYGCVRAYQSEPEEYVDETVVFGGIIYGHFGHLILDGMTRLWHFAEHPEDGLVRVFLILPGHKLFYPRFFELAGLKYWIVDKPTRFRKVIVPDEAFFSSTTGHPTWLKIFDHIKKKALDENRDSYPDKLYMTRTQFSRNDGVNEEYFEDFYRELGYTVISPEKLPLDEQIRYISSAKHIACTMGTLGHMCVFANEGIELTLLLRSPKVVMLSQITINRLKKFNWRCIEATRNLLPTDQTNGMFLYYPTRFFREYCIDSGILSKSEYEISSDKLLAYLRRWVEVFENPKNLCYIEKLCTLDYLETIHNFVCDSTFERRHFIGNDYSAQLGKSQYMNAILWKALSGDEPELAVHFAMDGWLFHFKNGEQAVNNGRTIEAIKLCCRQNIHSEVWQRDLGWSEAFSIDGVFCGKIGKSKPVTAIRLKSAEDGIDIRYRAQQEGGTWTAWCVDGELCGVENGPAFTGLQIEIKEIKSS